MATGRERAVLVNPLAQIAEDLLAGLVPVQSLQLPQARFARRRLGNSGEHQLGENGAFAVKALAVDGYVPILEEMRFDDGLEGGYGMTGRAHNSLRASGQVSYASP